jgi:hypothetical protein
MNQIFLCSQGFPLHTDKPTPRGSNLWANCCCIHTLSFPSVSFQFSFLQCSQSLLHIPSVLSGISKETLKTIFLLLLLLPIFCLLVWSYPTRAVLSFPLVPSLQHSKLLSSLLRSCGLQQTSQRTRRGHSPVGTHLRPIVMWTTLAKCCHIFTVRRKDKIQKTAKIQTSSERKDVLIE